MIRNGSEIVKSLVLPPPGRRVETPAGCSLSLILHDHHPKWVRPPLSLRTFIVPSRHNLINDSRKERKKTRTGETCTHGPVFGSTYPQISPIYADFLFLNLGNLVIAAPCSSENRFRGKGPKRIQVLKLSGLTEKCPTKNIFFPTPAAKRLSDSQ